MRPIFGSSPARARCLALTASAIFVLGWLRPVRAEFRPTKNEVAPPTDSVVCSRRNNVFYPGDPFNLTLLPPRGTKTLLSKHYQLRSYSGELVASGDVRGGPQAQLQLPKLPFGWYKLALSGDTDRSAGGRGFSRGPWGTVTGGTTLSVLRNDANFPLFPLTGTPETPTAAYANDEFARGALALGPQRHSITATLSSNNNRFDLATILKGLSNDVALDNTWYRGQWSDGARPRPLLAQFTNGVPGFGTPNADYNGVTQIVAALGSSIKNWEPRNEPQNADPNAGAAFFRNEYAPLYRAIKAGDPNAQVLAANTVSICPNDLAWLSGFMSAGGDRLTDAFSFHAYNVVNGDLELGRRTMNGLQAFLTQYGLQNVPKWQTEQGYMMAAHGASKPRTQGRQTMMQRMVFEQYGLPKERDVMWYDKAHGYWQAPVWWQNSDGSLNPAAVLMRVYSEEVRGATWVKAVDFGPAGNNAYIGNVFSNGTLVLMSAGNTRGQVPISGGSATDAWGNPLPITNTGGVSTVPVGELPVYVHGGSVQKFNWGANLVRQPGVTIVAPGQNPDRLRNGVMETWYYTKQGDYAEGADCPWNAGETPPSPQKPITVEVDFPRVQTVRRVVIYATPPWQAQSTLLDYDLQFFDGQAWQSIESDTEPENTEKMWTPFLRSTVDSYFGERWIFEHQFPAVSTNKLRLVVRRVTFGGAVNQDEFNATEYATKGAPRLVLREIEAYEDAPQRLSISGHVKDIAGDAPQGLAGVQMQLSGDLSATTTTDADGYYRFDDLSGGGSYTVAPKGTQRFTPAGRSVSNLSADATMDFANPSGDGLTADYFKSQDLTNFVTSRVSPQLNYDWGYGGPLCSEAGLSDSACEASDPTGIGINEWSGRWSGQIQALSNETYTFHTRSDDGIRLWVNGRLLFDAFDVDNGRGDKPLDRSATIALQEGRKYDIRLEYVERSNVSSLKLFWSTPTRPEEIVPQQVLYSAGRGTGLRGDYFGDETLSVRKATRLDPTINFNWKSSAPAPAVSADHFSVRWTGFIEPRYSQDYTFFSTSDNGLKLWIGDQLIIDNWNPNDQREVASAPIALRRGEKVPIKVEYFDDVSTASVVLKWSSASQNKEVVPQSQLFPGLGEGAAAWYFNGLDLSDLRLKRVDSQINFDWGLGSPAPNVPADGFSVRWQALVEPWFSENYTFFTQSDERIRLWVNDQLVIDNWNDHTSTQNVSAPIPLVAGQKFKLRVEYADVRSFALAKLFWQSTSLPKQAIPQAQLYPLWDEPATNTAPIVGAPVKQGPSVSLTAPSGGDTFYVGDPIGVSASASAPDGEVVKVELWANGAQIGQSSGPFDFTWKGAPQGQVTLFARAFDREGKSADSAPVTITVKPGDSRSDEPGTGLTGRYFDTEKFSELKLTRVDPQINFDWNGKAPAPAIAPNTFSIRWTGQIEAPTSDTYTFHLAMDEGARLWVDDQLIYDGWSYLPNERTSEPIALQAGQKVSIRLDYFQGHGSAKAQLRWSSSHMAKCLVPSSTLFPS